MVEVQVTSNVIVHYDHEIKRYVAMAEDTEDNTIWRFRATRDGVLAKWERDGQTSFWKFWDKYTVHRKTADRSPAPESIKVALIEAFNGFPCLQESADIAYALTDEGSRVPARVHYR